MSQSDRLFLEDGCPALAAKLAAKLVEDPNAQFQEHDIQDFEFVYSLATEGSHLLFQLRYPFLGEVLQHGSQVLLERVWEGLPVQLELKEAEGILNISVDSQTVGEDTAYRQRFARLLASARVFLLVGPLVERLRWLQETSEIAAAAAAKAPAGAATTAAGEAQAAVQVPPILELHIRHMETIWIVTKPDRVLVIMAVHLGDEVDVALGRVFCQEFAETNRIPNTFAPPCFFNESKDLPADLRSAPPANLPNVGFLTLTLSDQIVRGASEDRLHALARPVMTFRNFFILHLDQAKMYLNSRLRRRVEGWQNQLNLARRAPKRGQEKRRLVSGKEFVRPSF